MWNRFKTLDPWLFAVPLCLIAISVMVIYSLTVESAGGALYLRQAAFGLAGIAIMGITTFTDYRAFRAWWPWVYGLTAALLLIVRLPGVGKSDFGAQRWIDLGPFQLQPSELMKAAALIALAAVLSRSAGTVSARRFIGVGVLLVLPVLEVLAQPDLGTGIVIAASGTVLFLHAKLARWQRWAIGGMAAAIALSFALSFHGTYPFSKILKDYQKERLTSFLDPNCDPLKSCYNIEQSVIAVGSGGLTGNGLGEGNQSRLNFLPVAHADFIFAGISEAWGFVGSSLIITLFLILIFRCLQAARIAKDDFGMLLCIGIAVKFLVEAVVNIGMNVRLMPVTGIPLPFLSYGGTTLLVNAFCVGLVQSVVIRYKRLTF